MQKPTIFFSHSSSDKEYISKLKTLILKKHQEPLRYSSPAMEKAFHLETIGFIELKRT